MNAKSKTSSRPTPESPVGSTTSTIDPNARVGQLRVTDLEQALRVMRRFGVSRLKSQDVDITLGEQRDMSALSRVLEETGIPENHPLGKRIMAEAQKYVGERYAELTEAMDVEDPLAPDPSEPVDIEESDFYPDG